MDSRPGCSRFELFAWACLGATFAALLLVVLLRALDGYLTLIQSLPGRATVPGGVGCLT